MRTFGLIFSLLITITMVAALDTKWGSIPPLGSLLSPSHGFWKNAEPAKENYNLNIADKKLLNSVSVYFDERLVPHVFAQNNHDAFFVQGWLHARFRLWQMEFQTYAAAGRLSEILGEKLGKNSILEKHDRKFRRMGMLYAAENALKSIKKQDTVGYNALRAYADGANAFITQLSPDSYPIEYKILDYSPEAWSPLKSLLFLKYMSFDLANDADDFAFTNLLQTAGITNIEKMFPIIPDSLNPILAKNTPITAEPDTSTYVNKWAKPAGFKKAKMPANIDSTYFSINSDTTGIAYIMPETDPDNGSNNWVLDSTKTATRKPILCNDPHLNLTLPSIWYEMQIHTPEYNVYGVSFPGSPAIIIGFNDSIAWGVTNAMRDVMDFYEVKFKDSTMNEYWYDSAWKKTEWRTETMHIRGKADYADKIPMTVWGPVMYDGTYQSDFNNGKTYAIRWKAHDTEPYAEISAFIDLNKARNYADFKYAIKKYNCPGQNFIYASKRGSIAWWQQADFPAKWRRQGDFVMPGEDSSYAWQFSIKQEDNLHIFNPKEGFIATANQLPTADTLHYPYYLGGVHNLYRSFLINRCLSQMGNAITINDMQKLQTNNYNVFAEMAQPVLLRNIDSTLLSADAATLLDVFARWDLVADASAKGQTILKYWWAAFADTVWADDITRADGLTTPKPPQYALLEGIIRDTAFEYLDNRNTPTKENLHIMVTAALNAAAIKLKELPTLEWGKHKNTHVDHLLKLAPFSYENIITGGGSDIINATKETNGPSFRMIVQLTDKTEAWGVYPGGQSGNPGSRFYNQFINQWAAGKYYRFWIMDENDEANKNIKWTMTFRP